MARPARALRLVATPSMVLVVTIGGFGVSEPAQAHTRQAQSVQARSVQAQSVQARSVQAQSVQAQSVQARSVQAQSVQARAVRVTVAQGDSLWSIAARSGTTVAALRAANGLRGDLILRGQVLVVPARPAAAAPAAAARAAEPPVPSHPPGRHVIRQGDSLWSISRRYGVSLSALMAANGMNGRSLLLPGRTLVLPVRSATPVTPRAATSPARRTVPFPVARQDGIPIPNAVSRNRAVLDGLPRPSADQVRSAVAAAARRHGVDPSLALAVAFRESGLSQHLISPTNAIGAMQILPATARWIGESVAGRPLNPFLLEDNATAGVLCLKFLLDRAPGDTAIGAYYQGLASIRRQGPWPATRAYVAEVRRLQARFR